MYIVRGIFHLKFGHYGEAKRLLDEAYSHGLLPDAKASRILTDFTGDSYRLILEEGFDSLADYEKSLAEGMQKPAWKKWYERFKAQVESSHREILRQIM
jgi:hypothetical protein